MEQLTDRQQEIYDFIRDTIRSRGYGPTVREIGESFDITSPNGVAGHLKALKAKGFIKWEQGCSRTLSLVEKVETAMVPRADLDALLKACKKMLSHDYDGESVAYVLADLEEAIARFEDK